MAPRCLLLIESLVFGDGTVDCDYDAVLLIFVELGEEWVVLWIVRNESVKAF